MNISLILQVGISLMVVYYIAGLLVSFITQQISIAFSQKGTDLYRALENALGEKAAEILGDEIITQLKPLKTSPLVTIGDWIKKLVKKESRGVISGLSSSALAVAVLNNTNIIERDGNIPAVNSIIDAGIGKLAVETEQLQAQWAMMKQDMQRDVENWLDDVLVSGRNLYKENIRKVVITVALLVTIGLNIDTISIGKYFWREPIARQMAVAEADVILQNAERDNDGNLVLPEEANQVVLRLQRLRIPMFWDQPLVEQLSAWNTNGVLGTKMLGWLITWVALSQGSSFWYDALKKLKGTNSK